MATHSSVVARRIPGMEEPGGLPSMGLHRVGHDCSNLAAAAAAQGYTKQFHTPLAPLSHIHAPMPCIPTSTQQKAAVCLPFSVSLLASLRCFDPGEGNGNPLQYSCLENFMD